MELYEVLNCYCNRNSGAVSKDDKRKFSYMLRRLFSAQFPIQCELVNRLDSDPLVDAEVIALLALRFNGLPNFLKVKIDQKKKKESIRKYYGDDVVSSIWRSTSAVSARLKRRTILTRMLWTRR